MHMRMNTLIAISVEAGLLLMIVYASRFLLQHREAVEERCERRCESICIDSWALPCVRIPRQQGVLRVFRGGFRALFGLLETERQRGVLRVFRVAFKALFRLLGTLGVPL